MDREDEREFARRRAIQRAAIGDASSAPGVPGRTSVASLLPAGANGPYTGSLFDVQRYASGGESEADVHTAARSGIAGAGGALPHRDAIQRAFGRHDISGVRAHVGGSAAAAASAMGARAYATGDDIAFATEPDLHLAAHEAAHVVQQRGGVQLSGGVGQVGDAYERHADEVADLVVRGESAEALLDQMAGGAGGAAVQRVVQRDARSVHGHYQGTDVTLQLSQAGQTVVGRLQVHQRRARTGAPMMTSYQLSVERAWTNDGSDGFRGTATDLNGREVRITLVFSGTGNARVELGDHAPYELHRTSARAAASEATLDAVGELDYEAETAPTTGRQDAAIERMCRQVRTDLEQFFDLAGGVLPPATSERMSAVGRANTHVAAVFEAIPPEQMLEVEVRARAALQDHLAAYNGITWNLLDWLTIAMAQTPTADDAFVGAIRDHLHVAISGPGGAVSASDGTQQYRYRISVIEAAAEGELVAGGEISGGLLTVEALEPTPAPEDAIETASGRVLWRRTYTILRGRIEGGAEASVGGGIHGAEAIVTTPFPWTEEDFAGPVGGVGAEVGAEGRFLDSGGAPQLSASTLMLYGSGVYPALDVNFGNDVILGLEGSVGAGMWVEGGMIMGSAPMSVRDPAASAEHARHVHVPATSAVRVAFPTDLWNLTPAGLHALREVMAWNQALLDAPGTTVRVDAYASRLDDSEHNRRLTELRRASVMDAIRGMGVLADILPGDADGEAAAAAAGVPDRDDAAEWRRADVSINGVLVLQLYGAARDSEGEEETVDSHPVMPYGGEISGANVHAAARAGISGSGGALPHADAIQRSFGRHDVTGVRAHVGGDAAAAASSIGARAYATGNDIAFAASPDLHQAAHEAAHVVQQRGGVQLSGGVGRAGDPYERHADAVADRVVQGQSAESLLDSTGSGGATIAVQRDGEMCEEPRSAADLAHFAERFNSEFAAQLHVFAADDSTPAARRGPHVATSEAAASTASGDGVSPERLADLFTTTQIEKLTAFFADHSIPERLFDGDDVGHTTAQQRILLSGHILAVGHYAPGEYDQRVHARMCGHWANLVYSYAGVAEGSGAGVREEFDHTGALVLGVEDRVEDDGDETTGRAHRTSRDRELGLGGRHDAPEGARADFVMDGLPIAQFDTIEAGDWLYVYNDNGPGGGNHSVVFSRWASDTQHHPEPDGVAYRLAVTMSQTSPDAGGREELRALGEAFVALPGHGHITPITHVSHPSESARPMQTVEDLIAILGSGSEATANFRFIQRATHGRGAFDWAALAQYLRERNDAMISDLAPHMTERQQQVFRDTNELGHAEGAESTSAEGEIGLLVRLYQRLQILVRNAAALDAGAATERERVSDTHDAAVEEARPERERLESRIHALDAEATQLRAEHAPIHAAAELYREHTAELQALLAERRGLYRRIGELQDSLRGSLPPEEVEAIRTELRTIRDRIHAIQPDINRLNEEEHATRSDRRAAYSAERRTSGRLLRLTTQIADLRRDLSRLDASAGYVTAHGRVGRDGFNGRGEARAVNGLLSDLEPAPSWSSFVRAASTGGDAAPPIHITMD